MTGIGGMEHVVSGFSGSVRRISTLTLTGREMEDYLLINIREQQLELQLTQMKVINYLIIVRK